MVPTRSLIVVLLSSVFVTTGCANVLQGGALEESAKPGVPYWLPKSVFRVKLSVTRTKAGFDTKLSIEPQLVADTGELYVLRHAPNELASDDVKLKVDARGLLTSVKSTATDEIGQVVLKLAEIGATAAKLAAGVPAPPVANLRQGQRPPVTLDSQLERLLGTHEFLVDYAAFSGGTSLVPVAAPVSFARIDLSTGAGGAPPTCTSDYAACDSSSEGVRFRVAVPKEVKATFTVDYGSNGSHEYTVSNSLIASVPDHSPAFVLPFDRVPFVSVVRNATFDSGMLVALDVTRPSPVLNFFDLPLQLAERVVAVPTELLTFQVENLNAQSSLIEAQTGLIEKGAALQKAVAESQDP